MSNWNISTDLFPSAISRRDSRAVKKQEDDDSIDELNLMERTIDCRNQSRALFSKTCPVEGENDNQIEDGRSEIDNEHRVFPEEAVVIRGIVILDGRIDGHIDHHTIDHNTWMEHKKMLQKYI